MSDEDDFLDECVGKEEYEVTPRAAASMSPPELSLGEESRFDQPPQPALSDFPPLEESDEENEDAPLVMHGDTNIAPATSIPPPLPPPSPLIASTPEVPLSQLYPTLAEDFLAPSHPTQFRQSEHISHKARTREQNTIANVVASSHTTANAKKRPAEFVGEVADMSLQRQRSRTLSSARPRPPPAPMSPPQPTMAVAPAVATVRAPATPAVASLDHSVTMSHFLQDSIDCDDFDQLIAGSQPHAPPPPQPVAIMPIELHVAAAPPAQLAEIVPAIPVVAATAPLSASLTITPRSAPLILPKRPGASTSAPRSAALSIPKLPLPGISPPPATLTSAIPLPSSSLSPSPSATGQPIDSSQMPPPQPITSRSRPLPVLIAQPQRASARPMMPPTATTAKVHSQPQPQPEPPQPQAELDTQAIPPTQLLPVTLAHPPSPPKPAPTSSSSSLFLRPSPAQPQSKPKSKPKPKSRLAQAALEQPPLLLAATPTRPRSPPVSLFAPTPFEPMPEVDLTYEPPPPPMPPQPSFQPPPSPRHNHMHLTLPQSPVSSSPAVRSAGVPTSSPKLEHPSSRAATPSLRRTPLASSFLAAAAFSTYTVVLNNMAVERHFPGPIGRLRRRVKAEDARQTPMKLPPGSDASTRGHTVDLTRDGDAAPPSSSGGGSTNADEEAEDSALLRLDDPDFHLAAWQRMLEDAGREMPTPDEALREARHAYPVSGGAEPRSPLPDPWRFNCHFLTAPGVRQREKVSSLVVLVLSAASVGGGVGACSLVRLKDPFGVVCATVSPAALTKHGADILAQHNVLEIVDASLFHASPHPDDRMLIVTEANIRRVWRQAEEHRAMQDAEREQMQAADGDAAAMYDERTGADLPP